MSQLDVSAPLGAVGPQEQVMNRLLAEILRLSLERMPLDTFLQKVLERVVELPGFALQKKGAVMLVEERRGSLRLAAQYNLATEIGVMCAHVPFGHCLCGRVAVERRPLFRSCLDGDHLINYPGMMGHGHYVLPIMIGERLLGVMTLYVDHGHAYRVEEERFLATVADSIAGLIERRELEERADASRRFLLAVTRTIAEGVLVMDTQGRAVFANEAARRLLGREDGELLGRRVEPLFVPEGDASPHGLVLADKRLFRSAEHLLPRADGGEPVPVAYVMAPMIEGDTAVGTVTVLRDIREEKAAAEAREGLICKLQETQTQLLQAERMVSVGRLAAGVAHEINNPIGYVSANLGNLGRYVDDLLSALEAGREVEESMPPEASARHALEAIRKRLDLDFLRDDLRSLVAESRDGIDRVLRIVQDLKEFSRVDAGSWQVVDLQRGLESGLGLLQSVFGGRVEVVREYAKLPEVECLPGELNQAFTNLLTNAGQAIGDHGTIHVRTGVEGADWVWVEIEDDGCGIPAGELPSIFDPFYTTRPVGEGAGLGLSLAWGVVERHGGDIDVESEVGRGTRFRVRLPVRRSLAAHAA